MCRDFSVTVYNDSITKEGRFRHTSSSESTINKLFEYEYATQNTIRRRPCGSKPRISEFRSRTQKNARRNRAFAYRIRNL